MSTRCDEVQRRLAEDGRASIAGDEAAQAHVAGCDACFELLEALARVDEVLRDLPEADIPDAVVDDLLVQVARTRFDGPGSVPGALPEPRASVRVGPWRRLALRFPGRTAEAAIVLVATGVVAALLVPQLATRSRVADGLSNPAAGHELDVPRVEPSSQPSSTAPRDEIRAAQRSELRWRPEEEEARAVAQVGAEGPPAAPPPPSPEPRAKRVSPSTPPVEGEDRIVAESRQLEKHNQELSELELDAAVLEEAMSGLDPDDSGGALDAIGSLGDSNAPARSEGKGLAAEVGAAASRPDAERSADKGDALRRGGRVPIPDPTPAEPEPFADEVTVLTEAPVVDRRSVSASVSVGPTDELSEDAVTFHGGSPRSTPEARSGESVDEPTLPGRREAGQAKEEPVVGKKTGALADADPARLAARAFLAARRETEGLPFRSAAGYWANTYLPGEPEIRLLAARLRAGGLSGPHEVVRPLAHPYDPPTGAGLALTLATDRRAAVGPTRALVEVGLAASERLGGRRPTMNVALVLDLEGLSADLRPALRALALALSEAWEVGDRFHLLTTGPADLDVPPEAYRYGPLQLTLEELLGRDDPTPTRRPLTSVVAAATRAVAASDDPAAPLGSSLVLVATSRSLGTEAGRLRSLARRAAVDGVLLSTVGVGPGVDLAELEPIAYAGQGHRRLLAAPAEAEGLVDRELAAAGRVVARAVRLSIVLAPGVELVDVIGSYRLDERRAQEVRDAEQSVDRRLARSLGITADRGEDEAGIQIVIPAFYAGDTHGVLLDVVVPGPGPVADVTVRYKDLVELENGVARDRAELDRSDLGDPEERGPIERGVLRSYLGHLVAEGLRSVADDVVRGDLEEARTRVDELATLLAGLTVEVPGFESDPTVAADLELLRVVRALLESQPPYLVDSLRYAAHRKLQPAGPTPEENPR